MNDEENDVDENDEETEFLEAEDLDITTTDERHANIIHSPS